MKKIISPIAVAIIFTVSILPAFSFSDVYENSTYYEAIQFLSDEGIVTGYPDGSFHYGYTINRAELLTIVTRAVEDNLNLSSDQWDSYENESCFTDVKKGNWYTKYVCLAKDQGWVGGYPDGTFLPAKAVNFVEALKITMEALEIEYDSGTDVWYEGFFNSASEKQLIPSTISNVSQMINRGEMSELIARTLKYKSGELSEWLGAGEGEGEEEVPEDEDESSSNKVKISDYSTGVENDGRSYYIKLEVDDVGLKSGQKYYAECVSNKEAEGYSPDKETTSAKITLYFVKPETKYNCYVGVLGDLDNKFENSDHVYITTPDEDEGLKTYTDDYLGISLKYPIGAKVEIESSDYSDYFTIYAPSYFGEGEMRYIDNRLSGFYGYNSYSPFGATVGAWTEIGGKDFLSYYSDSVKDMGGWLDLPFSSYVYGFPNEKYKWVEMDLYHENSQVVSYFWSILDTLTFGTASSSLEITNYSTGLDSYGFPYVDLKAGGKYAETGQHYNYKCTDAGAWALTLDAIPQYDSYASAIISRLKEGTTYQCRVEIHNSKHSAVYPPSDPPITITTPSNSDQLDVVSSSVSGTSLTVIFEGGLSGYYYADCSPGITSGVVDTSTAYDPPGQTNDSGTFTFSNLTGDTLYQCYGDIDGKDGSPYVYGMIY